MATAEAKRKAVRTWQAKHPEARKAADAAYRAAHRAQIAAYNKAYYQRRKAERMQKILEAM